MMFSKKQKLLTEVYMKSKKVLPLISLAIAVTGKRLIIPKLLDNTDDEDDLPIA